MRVVLIIKILLLSISITNAQTSIFEHIDTISNESEKIKELSRVYHRNFSRVNRWQTLQNNYTEYEALLQKDTLNHARVLRYLATTYFFQDGFATYDSLRTVSFNIDSGKEHYYETIMRDADSYFKAGDFKKSEEYLNLLVPLKAEVMANDSINLVVIDYLSKHIAIAYIKKDLKCFQRYLDELLNYFERHKSEFDKNPHYYSILSHVLSLKSLLHFERKEKLVALQTFVEGIEKGYINIANTKGIAANFYAISALIYKELDENERADWAKEEYDTLVASGNIHPYFNELYEGLNAKIEKDWETVRKNAAKLHDRIQKNPKRFGLSYPDYYMLMTDYYIGQSELDSALLIIPKFMEVSDKMSIPQLAAYGNRKLGEVYQLKADYEKALIYYEKAKKQLDTIDHTGYLYDIHKQLLTIAKATDDKTALMKNQNALLALQERIAPYRFDKLVTLNYLAENEYLFFKNEKSNKKLYQNLAIFLAVSVLLLLGLFYKRTRENQQEKDSLTTTITALEEKDRSNKQLLSKLEDKNFKFRFMTNMTHELRTPVTVISGYTKELLDKQKNSSNIKPILESILNTSDNLLFTFNHLLNLSKNDANPLSSSPNKFQLKDFLNKIHYTITPILKTKAITYTQEDNFAADLSIITDAQKLETVLLNLLTNAIKFTPANDGIISIITTEEDQTIKITIQDNGRGIHEADIPHIFERLFQSQHHEETPAGGIGIGLAICKEYIELLEGTISVTSTLAVGTTFTITLPKTIHTALPVEPIAFPKIRPKVENEIERSPIDKNGAIEKPLVLIVDDNLEICKYLKTVLEAEYQLNFAYSGKNALRLVEDEAKELPDLIITDWMMSDMNGIALTQALKNVPTLANIPVIMLTARNLAKDQAVALEVGVDDYILKPFEAKVLRDSIKNLLHQAEEASNSSIYDTPPEQVKERYALLQNGTMNSINKKEYEWLIQVENFVQAHLGEFDLNTHFIAEQFSLTTVHLNRKIKQLTGLTTKKYIQEVRYWAARDMLEKGEYGSVKAVCLSVGFKDTKHFSRSFKKRFGEYPTEFLKE